MKFIRRLAIGTVAAVLVLNITACSAQSTRMTELVNENLAASGSTYTVTQASATAELINYAASVYKDYRVSLTNTELLPDDLLSSNPKLSDDEIESYVASAKASNLALQASFYKSLTSLNEQGLSSAFIITNEDVEGKLNDSKAVAEYVASKLTGNARIYVSDDIQVPVLDDNEGTYTGKQTNLRYVYIQYVE